MIKKKFSLISFFAITGIAFHSGCSKFNNDRNKNNSDFNSLSISKATKENTNIETSIDNTFENTFKIYTDSLTEAEKIDYLTKTYKRYLVQIQKKENKLYLTSNLNIENKEFSSINDLNRGLQKEIFSKNTENIKNFQNNYSIKFNFNSNHNNLFELESYWLNTKLEFNDFETAIKSIINEYQVITEKYIQIAENIIQGKVSEYDFLKLNFQGYNDNISDFIDAISNKNIVSYHDNSIVGSLFYPTFLFLINSDNNNFYKINDKNTINNTLIDIYNQYIKINETIIHLTNNKKSIPDELIELKFLNLEFQTSLVNKIGDLVKNKDQNKLDNTLKYIELKANKLIEVENNLNFKIENSSNNINLNIEKIKDNFSKINSLKDYIGGCQAHLYMDNSCWQSEFGYLSHVISEQEKKLYNFYNGNNFINSKDKEILKLYKNIIKFENNFKLFNQINSMYSYDKIKLINHLRFINESIYRINNIENILKEFSDIGYNFQTKKSFKAWLNEFNVELPTNLSIFHDYYKNIQNFNEGIELSATEFAILMTNQSGLGLIPLPPVNLLSSLPNQIFKQNISCNYSFNTLDNESEEYKIIRGIKDNQNSSGFEKITNRIMLLNDLSIKKSQLRVWHKLYTEIDKNPNINIENLIKKTRGNILAESVNHFYDLKALDNIFDKESKNKNIEHLKKSQNYLLNSARDNNYQLNFYRYIIKHLTILKDSYENETNNKIDISNIDINIEVRNLNTKEVSIEIKSMIDYLDLLGLKDDLEKAIINKISRKDSLLDSSFLRNANNYIEKNSNFQFQKNKAQFSENLNKFYFPDYLLPMSSSYYKNENEKKFKTDLFLKDLENYSKISESKKLLINDIISTIFNYEFDEIKAKTKIGTEFNTSLKNIYSRIYNQFYKFKNDSLPAFIFSSNQFDLYKSFNTYIFENENHESKINKIKKIGNRLLKTINAVNIGMNIVYTPSRIFSIHSLYNEKDYIRGSRETGGIIIDSFDMFIDIYRNKDLLKSNPTLFHKLAKAQIALNTLSAGFSLWQGIDNLIEAKKYEGKRKQDLQVNGAINIASAAVSLSTIAAAKLTAMAGPVGAATGFILMSAQSIYTAVRFHESLTELGVDEQTKAALVSFSIMTFGMQFDHSNVPGVAYASKVHIKKNQLKESLKHYNDNHEKSGFYFEKIITPEIRYYYPYTRRDTTTHNGSYLQGSSTTTIGGQLLIDQIHQCQTNNIYPENILNQSNKLNLNSLYEILDHKKYKKMILPASEVGVGYGNRYYDDTRYCEENSLNKYSLMTTLKADDNSVLTELQKNNLSNLIYVGIDDQYKHGSGISYINGENNYKNFFIINKGQYHYNLKGANKNDYFEIRSQVSKKFNINGSNFYKLKREPFKGTYFYSYNIKTMVNALKNDELKIYGNDGIDTLSMQFFEMDNEVKDFEPNIFIRQSENQLIKDNPISDPNRAHEYKYNYYEIIGGYPNIDLERLPEVEGIEQFIGSKYNDIYIATSQNDFIYGNKGKDKLYGAAGDDVLFGGEDIDYLVGGEGNDTYMISKEDFLVNKDSYDIINIFDKNTNRSPFYTNNIEEKDFINTDITNLGMIKENNDLWIVTKSDEILKRHNLTENEHVKIVKIENFFQAIIDNNNNLPILSSKDGFIYNYDPSLISSESILWLDTIMINTNYEINKTNIFNIHSKIDTKIGLRLDTLKNLSEITTVIGSPDAEIIIGNNKDNVLNGVEGNDHLNGMDGDDILISSLDLTKNKPTLDLHGGRGEDIYFISIKNASSAINNNANIYINDIDTNSIINIDFPDYSNITYGGYMGSNQINFYDTSSSFSNQKVIFTLHFNNKIRPRKVLINTSKESFTIGEDFLNFKQH